MSISYTFQCSKSFRVSILFSPRKRSERNSFSLHQRSAVRVLLPAPAKRSAHSVPECKRSSDLSRSFFLKSRSKFYSEASETRREPRSRTPVPQGVSNAVSRRLWIKFICRKESRRPAAPSLPAVRAKHRRPWKCGSPSYQRRTSSQR